LRTGFAGADVDSNQLLSIEEARTLYSALTQEEFDELDLDSDGFLSEAELDERLNPAPTGCCNNDATTKGLRDFLGDLFLLGIALVALAGWQSFRKV